MPIDHKARPGDCVCSVSIQKGLDPAKVWNLSENQKLRDRTDVSPAAVPEIVNPGDVIHLPDRQTKWEKRADGEFHPFKVKTVPLRLKIRFHDKGEPRANLKYTLQIDGKKTDGTLDADGLLDEPLPPSAADVRVRLGEPDSGEDYFIKLGHLDPVGRVTGMQQRLHNLGYDPGAIDGIFGPRTRSAMLRFQADQGLSSQQQGQSQPAQPSHISVAVFATVKPGDPDDATLRALADVHGS